MIQKLLYAALAPMILLAAASTSTWADGNWRSGINWQTYQEAQPGKSDSDRKYFIYFFSKRCGYCRKLERESFSNSTIADYINKNYFPIIVDIDIERELAARSGVRGVPDLRFLTPDNKLIARLPGYVPRDTLFNLLQYIQTDSYKSMALNEFVRMKKKK